MRINRREFGASMLGALGRPAAGQEPQDQLMDRVATGFRFTEGPAWSREGFLLFSDVPNDKIMKYVPGQKPTERLRPLPPTSFTSTQACPITSSVIAFRPISYDSAGWSSQDWRSDEADRWTAGAAVDSARTTAWLPAARCMASTACSGCRAAPAGAGCEPGVGAGRRRCCMARR